MLMVDDLCIEDRTQYLAVLAQAFLYATSYRVLPDTSNMINLLERSPTPITRSALCRCPGPLSASSSSLNGP